MTPGASRGEQRGRYTGRGYWAVQLIASAVLAILGLGGGLFIVFSRGVNPNGTPMSVEPGELAFIFATGFVFLLLFVWLLTRAVSGTREERAIQAWAIMQQHSANGGGVRPLPTSRAVRNDVESMRVARLARDGRLPLEEIQRLQALRPEVPYPGDLGLVSQPRRPSPAEQEQRKADDAAAAALVGAPLERARTASQVMKIAARVAGWVALALFVAFVIGSLEPWGVLFLCAMPLWVLLRLGRGIAESVHLSAGRRIAESWLTDPVQAARGLPTPLTPYLTAPRGSWWWRLAWPAELLGVFLMIGAVSILADAGLEGAGGSDIALTVIATALTATGIALWVVRDRLQTAATRRTMLARGPRSDEDILRNAGQRGA